MKNDIQLPWITTGYKVFAYEGPQGLKIERLARKIGKNKSSFYHLFADLDIFVDHLLAFHLEQAARMAEKEAKSKTLEEFIDIIIEHKIDLLFNRQLRVHRENSTFEKCFTRVNQLTGPAMIGIWTTILDLKENSYLAELVLKLSLDNFFLQITDETLNTDWLNGYFNELRTLIKAFKAKATNNTIQR